MTSDVTELAPTLREKVQLYFYQLYVMYICAILYEYHS